MGRRMLILEYSTDATAAFSVEHEHAATKLIWPLFADKLMTAGEWVSTLSKL